MDNIVNFTLYIRKKYSNIVRPIINKKNYHINRFLILYSSLPIINIKALNLT